MATHSIILAWKILQTEEPGGLQFMGSPRVGHEWAHTTTTSVFGTTRTHDFWETSCKKVSHYGLTRQGDPIMILHFTLHVGIGHTYLNFSEILVLCLLLFSRSVMSDSFVTPWTLARRAPLSIWFSRQESWSGLQFPSPGDLPDPGIKPTSPALASRFFATEPPGKLGT